jgi:hypothetical protein
MPAYGHPHRPLSRAAMLAAAAASRVSDISLGLTIWTLTIKDYESGERYNNTQSLVTIWTQCRIGTPRCRISIRPLTLSSSSRETPWQNNAWKPCMIKSIHACLLHMCSCLGRMTYLCRLPHHAQIFKDLCSVVRWAICSFLLSYLSPWQN